MSDACKSGKMVNLGHFGRSGPGPGKYLLPTNVGYPDHDYTRNRAPMYSMSPKTYGSSKLSGPGPKYQLDHMTRVGKATSPAYSLSSRHNQPSSMQKSPGPAEYLPRRGPVMPAYSMSYRHGTNRLQNYPGPDKYMLPTTIGPKVPDKRANAAYSMSYRHYTNQKGHSPGPAEYTPTRPDVYKQRLPDYTMRPHLDPPGSKSHSPGPKYYPKFKDCKTGYSFGLRLDNVPYITCADEIPCV